MLRCVTVLVLLAFHVVAAIGQELKPIEVVGPASPIPKAGVVFIPVNNLNEEEFLAATITVTPQKGAIAFRVYGAPLIIFQGNEPGKYTVSIGRNVQHIEWIKPLAESVTYAKAVSAPADFVSRLEKLHTDAVTAFPSRGGSCVVEVAGAVVVPTDPTVPTDPPTTPSKVDRVTYVWEKDLAPIPFGVTKALQRINAESAGAIVASTFEEDTPDGSGDTPEQYKLALEAAKKVGVPALVIQSGANVLKTIKAPTTEAAVLEAIKPVESLK